MYLKLSQFIRKEPFWSDFSVIIPTSSAVSKALERAARLAGDVARADAEGADAPVPPHPGGITDSKLALAKEKSRPVFFYDSITMDLYNSRFAFDQFPALHHQQRGVDLRILQMQSTCRGNCRRSSNRNPLSLLPEDLY